MKKIILTLVIFLVTTTIINAQSYFRAGIGTYIPSELNESIKDFTLFGGHLNYSQEDVNGAIWGVFVDFKVETVKATIPRESLPTIPYSYKIDFTLTSYGAEYLFSPNGIKNIFLGGEVFYSKLSIDSKEEGFESNSFSGFGFAPKVGFRYKLAGGFASFEAKYINLEVGKEEYDLGGFGLQLSYWFIIN